MAVLKYRRPIVIAGEIAIVTLSNYLGFLLRFDWPIPPPFLDLFVHTLPLVIAIRALLFIPFRLYEGLWRYTSLWDVRNIAASTILSSSVLYLIANPILDVGYPRGVILIDALLLVFLLTGVRMTRRVFREFGGHQGAKGVLIYGAGDAGELVLRDMRNNSFYGKDPVGFIDDDVRKVGRRIHGVPVLGTRNQLKEILERIPVHEVLIAMPHASGKQLRDIVKALEPFKVAITTLPNLRDILDGKVTVDQIRQLALEDLLQRPPVGLDPRPVQELVQGRRVLVTGAGGSIGSELCRQIAKLQPELLVLVDHHEPSVYAIHKELDAKANTPLVPKVTDVGDRAAMNALFRDLRPEIIFHAAAYKHVPLMESNPCAAIKNNVGGTRNLLELSEANHVERLILISTDKAVNPLSIMGASKRIAELLTQSMASRSTTRCSVVRFGNVLGSNGSVVPRFLEQIRAGGPVTVTDPEMRRYFMLIPEAVQLVMHAAALNEAGATYVLDMGEEFKVLDLAKNMIRLTGQVPDEDIQIQFIGLRPGEKLSEKLIEDDETIVPSAVDKIRRVHSPRLLNHELLAAQVGRLEAAAALEDKETVTRLLHEIIPTFGDPPVRRETAEIPPATEEKLKPEPLLPQNAVAQARLSASQRR
jgi:FlaA1/EpsC-like NDP-sugar epimerase